MCGSYQVFLKEGFGAVVGVVNTRGMGGYFTIIGGGVRFGGEGTLPWKEMDQISPFVKCDIPAMGGSND